METTMKNVSALRIALAATAIGALSASAFAQGASRPDSVRLEQRGVTSDYSRVSHPGLPGSPIDSPEERQRERGSALVEHPDPSFPR
jgi:hypothetical protein